MKHPLAPALLVSLTVGSASADPLGANDYAAIFAQFPNKVVSSGNQRHLSLSENITISETVRTGTSTYTGMDLSTGGALGCAVSMFARSTAVTRKCPSLGHPLTAEQQNRLLEFYALNSFPKAEPEVLNARFEEIVQQQMADLPNCDLSPDVLIFIKAFSTQSAKNLLDILLHELRLPVSNPCL